MLFLAVALIILFGVFWYRKPIQRKLADLIYQTRKFSDIYLLSLLLLIGVIFFIFLWKRAGGLFLLSVLIFFALTFYYYAIKEKIPPNRFYAAEWVAIISIFILVDLPLLISNIINQNTSMNSDYAAFGLSILLIQLAILFFTRKAVLHFKQRKAHWQAIGSDKNRLE